MKDIKTHSIGGNAGRNRTHNRRVVLDYVRANEPTGRAEISKSCGLSFQAVSNIIEALQNEGLLVAVGHKTGERGQPAAQYKFNPESAFSVGIELRPDALICATLNLKGDCIYRERLAISDTSPAKAIPEICDMVDRAIVKIKRSREQLLGVGVVMPGPFGASEMSDLEAAIVPDWDDVDVQKVFEEALKCPVIAENDATAAAISERVAGVASAIDTYCFVYFGAGLGLGVMTNGHAQRGAFGNFGEIGHVITQVGGNECSCGNYGCLETYASRISARKFLAVRGIDVSSGAEMATLLEQNNPDFIEWIDIAAKHLSQAIGILENIFDPETIVFGGAMPDAVIDALIERLELPQGSVANRKHRTIKRVLRGSSGHFTAAIGGASLIIHQTTTPSIAVYS
ncbi:MAG: ROK family transcriptional regulator [Rhizobiales bacterium]|nr:ROK family transcriptional regulator [Hyphomicrobiales bacterium]NRB14919.1 ROK family transcriptional regulator [Hyphomicrobiales bacterium]